MVKLICFTIGLVFSLHVCAQDDIEVINIENAAVQEYMKDMTYLENPGTWNTVVYKYSRDYARFGNNLDWPGGKRVEWTSTVPTSDIKEYIISVSQNEDFSDAATHYTDKPTDRTFIIRNLLPNCTYYYRVEEHLNNGSVNILNKGKFRTIGQVRMIQVRNSHNIRDMGGWKSQYGRSIRYGILYRSGSLESMNNKGRHDFAGNLKVAGELDLRQESHLKTSRLGEDAAFLLIPHDAGTKGLVNNNSVYPRDLRWIIGLLKEGKAVDWHCAMGCDRCGAVSFLIGGLLGMSEFDLCRDFELSSFTRNYNRPRSHVGAMFKVIRKYGPEDNLAKCFYEYWKSIGMTEEELNFFINYMLGYPEDHVLDTSGIIEDMVNEFLQEDLEKAKSNEIDVDM